MSTQHASDCRFLVAPDYYLLRLVGEDVPYGDTTTLSLGIGGLEGEARVYTREDIVASSVEEAARIYELLGSRVLEMVPSGTMAGRGEMLLRVRGKASSLHTVWRAAQLIIAFSSGVATYTRRMVEKASSLNGGPVIATTRKAPLGAKHYYVKGVLCGGGVVHRYGLSDSILVFENHLRFISGISVRKAVELLRKRHPERKIGVEVKSLEEAIEALDAGAEYIQFEKLKPEEASEAIKALKKRNPHVTVGLAGGIKLENVEAYARTGADVLVTSAPYSASPADITTVIDPLSPP